MTRALPLPDPINWSAPIVGLWRARKAWVLDRQVAIAATAAPTGQETHRAQVMQRELEAAGRSPVRIDGAGNVIMRIAPPHLPVAAPTVVCLAHLDTVYATDAPIQVTRVGQQLVCPGIGDNGRGLAATVALAHALQAPGTLSRMRRPVELVATVGEEGEGNLRGAHAYFDDAESRARQTYAAVAIDGPGDSTIVHHAVGSHRLRVHLRGHSGHSWVNVGTPSPVNAAGTLISSLARLSAAERGHAVVTVSRMGGGETLTSIPRDAWLDVDIRAIDGERIARLRRTVMQLAECAATAESRHAPTLALQLRIETLGERPAGALDAMHPLVRLATAATERVGRAPRSGSASTDANVPLSRGIPAIAIGAGGVGGAAHTLDEWYDDANSEIGLARVIDLVTALACTDAH